MRLLNHRDPESLSVRLRRKRFALFLTLLSTLPRPIRILDIGGEQNFWEMMEFTDDLDVQIVLLNLSIEKVNYSNFKSVVGDARDLSMFDDQEFDVVFSNSVIEHLTDFTYQERMAKEVQRVGKSYFIQTPNLFFPLEPHFHVPLFQFLPLATRVFLIRHFNLGWYQKIPDKKAATEFVQTHRLLSERELRWLFPKATLYKELFLGFTKSFIVYDGFGKHRPRK